MINGRFVATRNGVPIGIMPIATYDPDKDGLIALAQLVAAVCSETEADDKIAAARLYSKAKEETRDMTAASGDVSYTGYGFEPSALVVFSCINNLIDVAGWGFSDSAVASALIIQTYIPDFGFGANIVYLHTAAGDRQHAIVKSYDAEGFTLTWTKGGSPTGTANIEVLALK